VEAPTDRREAVAALAAGGRQDLRAGRVAADQSLTVPAATLYGGSLLHFANARAAAASGGKTSSTAAEIFATMPEAATEAGKDALALLDDPDGATSTLEPRKTRRALNLLERAAFEAGAGLYPASDAEIARLRIRRSAFAAAVLAVVLGGALRWATAPHNVARGKPVTASSVRFGSPGALVNGAIEWGSFGLHTGGSGREWATIDLESFYTLSSAEIYSRGEGRFEFNLPLSVELSDDGATFRSAGACKDLFTQATPCVVDLHHQRARYVRVTAPEVVLAEVEVYAKP
jgi:hypothetical protein